MVDVGEKAPDIEVLDNEGKKVKLSDFRGKNIVLYFYPRDDTPGCTREACGFRDDVHEIRKMGAEVIGVSVDSPESHQRFIKKYGLDFPLLADKDKKMTKAFGALKDTGTAMRVTYIIDKNGVVRHFYPKVSPEGHSREMIEKLKEL